MFDIAHVDVAPAPIHPAVMEAAGWLDRVKPGWAALVDPDALEMGRGDTCVLGHVFRDEARAHGGHGYSYGKYVALAGASSPQELHAFFDAFGADNGYRSHWRAAIQQRVPAAA